MLEIQTNDLKTRKKVLIDGHPYTVRKLGAGEELTLSQYMREVSKLQSKEEAGTLTETEEASAVKMSQETMNIMASCFDDGMGGKKSAELVRSLSTDELQEVLKAIFKDKTSESSPEVEAS